MNIKRKGTGKKAGHPMGATQRTVPSSNTIFVGGVRRLNFWMPQRGGERGTQEAELTQNSVAGPDLSEPRREL